MSVTQPGWPLFTIIRKLRKTKVRPFEISVDDFIHEEADFWIDINRDDTRIVLMHGPYGIGIGIPDPHHITHQPNEIFPETEEGVEAVVSRLRELLQ